MISTARRPGPASCSAEVIQKHRAISSKATKPESMVRIRRRRREPGHQQYNDRHPRRFERRRRKQRAFVQWDWCRDHLWHPLFTNNLITANATYGVVVDSSNGANLENNTIAAQSGDLVVIEGNSSNVQLLNNILWATSGSDINVAADSQQGFASEFNDLYATGMGTIGVWQGKVRTLWMIGVVPPLPISRASRSIPCSSPPQPATSISKASTAAITAGRSRRSMIPSPDCRSPLPVPLSTTRRNRRRLTAATHRRATRTNRRPTEAISIWGLW